MGEQTQTAVKKKVQKKRKRKVYQRVITTRVRTKGLPGGRSRNKKKNPRPATQTGIKLMEGIIAGTIDPQTFGGNNTRNRLKRLLVVQVLRNKGQSISQVADFLQISNHSAWRYVRDLDQMWGEFAMSMDVEGWVGRIFASAEIIISNARDKGDDALAWRVQKELAGLMQDIGTLQKAPEKHEVRGVFTFEDFARRASGEDKHGKVINTPALPPAKEAV